MSLKAIFCRFFYKNIKISLKNPLTKNKNRGIIYKLEAESTKQKQQNEIFSKNFEKST